MNLVTVCFCDYSSEQNRDRLLEYTNSSLMELQKEIDTGVFIPKNSITILVCLQRIFEYMWGIVFVLGISIVLRIVTKKCEICLANQRDPRMQREIERQKQNKLSILKMEAELHKESQVKILTNNNEIQDTLKEFKKLQTTLPPEEIKKEPAIQMTMQNKIEIQQELKIFKEFDNTPQDYNNPQQNSQNT